METKNGYVKWKTLTILVIIAIATIGSAIGIAMSAKDKASANEVKIEGVETNIEWIRGSLDRIELKLK